MRGLIDKAGLGRSFTRFIDGTGRLKTDDLMAICSALHIRPEEIIKG
ncbi:MAG: helix-turn-helix domain-containing protein [Lachnospiraceae bacterium]|nr:helix-turn-helix domain-containing protein [Lachnospiraceae bacterium]